jgi:hypothetical protein
MPGEWHKACCSCKARTHYVPAEAVQHVQTVLHMVQQSRTLS